MDYLQRRYVMGDPPNRFMTSSELEQLLNSFRSLPGETEVVEFKEAKTTYDFTKLGKYFSALANEANLKSKPYAWLIFGVKDRGRTVVGSQFRPNRNDLDSLKGEIANKTTNRITFIDIHELFLAGSSCFRYPLR
jgi:ATP-dependent DNA helicase RecG